MPDPIKKPMLRSACSMHTHPPCNHRWLGANAAAGAILQAQSALYVQSSQTIAQAEGKNKSAHQSTSSIPSRSFRYSGSFTSLISSCPGQRTN